jgi:hypothetical protein
MTFAHAAGVARVHTNAPSTTWLMPVATIDTVA